MNCYYCFSYYYYMKKNWPVLYKNIIICLKWTVINILDLCQHDQWMIDPIQWSHRLIVFIFILCKDQCLFFFWMNHHFSWNELHCTSTSTGTGSSWTCIHTNTMLKVTVENKKKTKKNWLTPINKYTSHILCSWSCPWLIWLSV